MDFFPMIISFFINYHLLFYLLLTNKKSLKNRNYSGIY